MNADHIRQLLGAIKDEKTQQSIVEMGFVQHVMCQDQTLTLLLELPATHMKTAADLKAVCEQFLKDKTPFETVRVGITQHKKAASPSKQPKGNHGVVQQLDLPQFKHIIAVCSGKGGVGKSTISLNLSLALAQTGAKVGLLDLDIYGPSLNHMMGVHEKVVQREKKFVPQEKYGLPFLSMAGMIPPEKAVIWRGPMVQLATQQMLRDAHWPPLDILVLDTPPGTGDVHLTLAETVSLSGVIVVSTPQALAQIDAKKSHAMFETVNVPILGWVENMQSFHCPHCHAETPLFDTKKLKETADAYQVPLLAAVPFDTRVRESGDGGMPLMADASAPDYLTQPFHKMAGQVKGLLGL